MAMAGLYRRLLPSPPAIDFASSDGKVSQFAPLALPQFQYIFFLINDHHKLVH